MIIKKFLALIGFFVLYNNSHAQSTESKGWFFLTHTQKISKKMGALLDVQFRSSDKLKHIETILLRGAASYNFSDEHAVAVGYAYKGDWEEGTAKRVYQVEQRLYEQYLFNHSIKRTEFAARFRLEQRFVKEDDEYKFSQRSRGFVSLQIPLAANADFSKGLYTTLQNELFVNVQNKENVNNSFFDQNRAYISTGYRWSKKIDTEIGYMHWWQKEMSGRTSSSVVQLMITTDL